MTTSIIMFKILITFIIIRDLKNNVIKEYNDREKKVLIPILFMCSILATYYLWFKF